METNINKMARESWPAATPGREEWSVCQAHQWPTLLGHREPGIQGTERLRPQPWGLENKWKEVILRSELHSEQEATWSNWRVLERGQSEGDNVHVSVSGTIVVSKCISMLTPWGFQELAATPNMFCLCYVLWEIYINAQLLVNSWQCVLLRLFL